MNKVTIANINMEFKAINSDFFDKRLRAYRNINFDENDMILKTIACDEIEKPVGVMIEQINNVTIIQVGDNKFCRYLKSSEIGKLLNAFYYNKDYSEVEIYLPKSVEHPIFSITDFEYMYTGFAFSDRITALGGVVLHGSAIAYKGQGVIFSANSGTGKSTHTNLWNDRRMGEHENK